MANKKTILVMGSTGSGKSTFINSVFGEDPKLEKPAVVGAESFSCTKKVEEFLYEHKDGLSISLVDSPGFDNFEDGPDSKSDAEIMEMMIDFLKSRDGESEHGPGVFSGVVFLHSINSLNPAELPGKTMRQLKVLCGKDQLNNKFIVATNRWEDFQCDDLDDQSSEEEMLELLLDSNKTLKELHDAGVKFVRTCSLNYRVTPPGNSYEFKSPRAIVEQLLGLEHEEDLMVNVEATRTSDSHSRVLADETEPVKEERKWTLEDSPSVTNHANSQQAETNEQPLGQHLNGHTERSYDTPEDSQSATSCAESEQAETNEDPSQCTDEREWPFLDFGDRLKEDPQMSLLVTVLKSFADRQTQELKSMHAAMLKMLGSQVVELKQALGLSHQQPINPVSGLRGQTKSERDRIDTSKETKEEFEARDQELAGLWQKVQAQGAERELVRLRTQLQDGTRRIASLETELEQEREKAEKQARVNEALSQQVACLEQELQTSKTTLGSLVQESAHPRKEVQDRSTSRRFSTSRISPTTGHGLAPVRRHVERIEGRLHTQGVPSKTDSKARTRKTRDLPKIEVQGLVSQALNWEQELRTYENVPSPSPSRARTPTSAQQSPRPPTHPYLRRTALTRAGAPLSGAPLTPSQSGSPLLLIKNPKTPFAANLRSPSLSSSPAH